MVPVIEDHWKHGYRITDIEQTLGKWMCLFTKYSDEKAQVYESRPTIEKLEEAFLERQENGYDLIDLAEGW
jgi:hypothetical protein